MDQLPAHRVRLFDHRSVVELRRRRINVTAGGDDERYILLAQLGRDGPHVLTFQVHVEDREVESAFLDLLESALHRIASSANGMTEGIEEILEHHGDQRLILDDQD
jgi:hypothetical protein